MEHYQELADGSGQVHARTVFYADGCKVSINVYSYEKGHTATLELSPDEADRFSVQLALIADDARMIDAAPA